MENLISLLVLAWVCSALAGMGQVASKGYLGGLTWNVGCVMFILVGWWSIPLLLLMGPLWLLIGASLEPKRECPHCRRSIPGGASRCSFCQGDVVPLVAAPARGDDPPASSSL